MITQISKKITQIKFILIPILLICSSTVFALTYTSPNYILKDARIVVSGGTANSSNYSLDDVQIGKLTSGQAESPNYTLDATNVEKPTPQIPPNPPTVNPVKTPTNVSSQNLTGTKDTGSAIYINGYQRVPLDNQTTWSYNQSLSEGNNYLIITARSNQGLESSSVTVTIFLDTSAPTKPSVTDDGTYTTSKTQLHARWASSDPQTGIVEYQYAIGTTTAGTNVVGWTSVGTQTEITRTGLTLTQGQTYYISVKAKNGVGSWSQVGSSDGIKVNQHPPLINTITPADGSGFYPDELVTISATASDADGDPLQYQFSVDNQVKQAWSASSTYNWTILSANVGLRTIKVEVTDNLGGLASRTAEVYIFLMPPRPPNQ